MFDVLEVPNSIFVVTTVTPFLPFKAIIIVFVSTVCIAMVIVVSFALPLRIISRSKLNHVNHLGEYLFGMSTILFYTYSGVLLAAILNPYAGGSLEFADLSLPQINNYLVYIYVLELLFVYCISTAKLSILMFYTTLFPTEGFRRIAYGVCFLCIIWLVIANLIFTFRCSSVSAMWNVELQQTGAVKCLSQTDVNFGLEATNIALDVIILALPNFVIKGLQLKRSKKITIGFIFILGGLVCIVCAIRMYWVYYPNSQILRPLPGIWNWSTVELASTIICASVPTYGPLFNSADGGFTFSVRNWYKSWLSSINGLNWCPTSQKNSRIYTNTNDNSYNTNSCSSNTAIEAGKKSYKNHSSTDPLDRTSDIYPLNGIVITGGVEIA